MALSVAQASELLREAVRDTVQRSSLSYLVQGGILVAAGVLALLAPFVASGATTTMLGWMLIASGAAQVISLRGATEVPYFWLQLVSVVLSILVGLLFLRDPAQSLLTISLLLIVFFMIEGISKLIFALTIRPVPNWIWILASGGAGIALSLILWSSLPDVAPWFLGLLLGIELISVGAAHGYMGWCVRKSSAGH